MNQNRLLCDMDRFQTGTVKKISRKLALAARLSDFGLMEGSRITVLYKSPFGDPAAYRINNTAFALRNKDSALITVSIDKV